MQDNQIQLDYLTQLIESQRHVVIFLMNGFQMRGTIKAQDMYSVLVEADGCTQLIYKHAISTIK